MKVMMILGPLDRGGAETLILDICRNVKINDFELIIVATNGGAMENDFRNSGIKFVTLQRKLPIDIKLIFGLRKIIKQERVEIIHAHQILAGAHSYFASLGRKTKKILSFHGYGYRSNIKAKLLTRLLIRRMNANIAVSEAFLTDLAGDSIDVRRFYTVYNGVDVNKFTINKNYNIKSELGLSSSAFLMGMVGNFVNNARDQLTICQALPEIFLNPSLSGQKLKSCIINRLLCLAQPLWHYRFCFY